MRSILSAFSMHEEGLMWRIGDGRSVKILGDTWLPKPSSFKIQSPCQGLNVNATISTLIDTSTVSWNGSFIRQSFNQEEVEIICNFPISKYGQGDILYWRVFL